MKVIFFNSKIKDYLSSLLKQSSSKAGKLIDLLETFGNKLGMPILNNLKIIFMNCVFADSKKYVFYTAFIKIERS
jgi:hypothetical protein